MDNIDRSTGYQVEMETEKEENCQLANSESMFDPIILEVSSIKEEEFERMSATESSDGGKFERPARENDSCLKDSAVFCGVDPVRLPLATTNINLVSPVTVSKQRNVSNFSVKSKTFLSFR